MDKLIATIRSTAAEVILLAQRPLTKTDVAVAVEAKLLEQDRCLAVRLSELQLAAELSRAIGAQFCHAEQVELLSPSSLTVTALTRNNSPETHADPPLRSVQTIVNTLFVMDPNFVVSPGGYCVYPCRPSMLASCQEIETLLSSVIGNPGLTSRVPFFQFRRRLAFLVDTATTMCTKSVKLTAHQSLRPGIDTAPTLHSWLAKWRDVVSRGASKEMGTVVHDHQFRETCRLDWCRELQMPISNGFVTGPISIQDLNLLLGYYRMSLHHRRLSFRQWLDRGILGPLPGDARLRFARERRVRKALLNAVGHRSNGELVSAIGRRNWRQLFPSTEDGLSASITVGQLVELPSPTNLCGIDAAGGADKDVFVFSASRATIELTVLSVIDELQRQQCRPAADKEESSEAQGVPLADVCRALLWTHEYGEAQAVHWMRFVLKMFPANVAVSSDGARVRLYSHRKG